MKRNLSVATLTNKKHILDEAGYAYDFERMIYLNRQAKKAFSVEFVEDQPEEELQRRIGENTGGEKWQFYFNTPPSKTVIKELERVLG